MNFKSDNTAPVHPEIMEALIQVNKGHVPSYGNDEYCQKAKKLFKEVFEHDVHVFFVSTGSIANSLSLETITPPYGMIFTAEDAHVQVDEANCVEKATGGAKLKELPSSFGKILPELMEDLIIPPLSLRPHMAKPSALTLTQATEWGTVYQPHEIQRLCHKVHEYGLKTHMDGARFANALVHLNTTPAELTWKAGIDIMSFGATKNGAMQAEAIVVFNSHLAQELDYRVKQAGQLPAKQRYWATQFIQYFHSDLWLKLARHANAMAQKLAHIFKEEGFELLTSPIQANEVFVKLPTNLAEHMTQLGVGFYPWGSGTNACYRFVTSWNTHDDELEALKKKLHINN